MALKSNLLLLFAVLLLFYNHPTEALKTKKVTRIQFYMHGIIGGRNTTAVQVAGPVNYTGPNSMAEIFGDVYVMDNPLTVTPVPNSTVLGRAQGINAMSSQLNEFSVLMTLTVQFISGAYNGSSFSILGRNPIVNEVREMPVVGGTWMFRLARRYCFAQTHSVVNFDAVIGYNVTLIHY